MRLQSFLAGEWCEGSGPDQPLTDPCTGAVIATASADGLDRGTALAHARAVGGPGLRRLTYGARAQMLAAVAETLAAGRERYFEIARRNSGNTRADAALDIDGAIGTLKYFSR